MALTRSEKAAIKAFEELAARWPKSLWVFAASNSLCIMKEDAEGRRAMLENGSYDHKSVVATIAIECDGGDW